MAKPIFKWCASPVNPKKHSIELCCSAVFSPRSAVLPWSRPKSWIQQLKLTYLGENFTRIWAPCLAFETEKSQWRHSANVLLTPSITVNYLNKQLNRYTATSNIIREKKWYYCESHYYNDSTVELGRFLAAPSPLIKQLRQSKFDFLHVNTCQINNKNVLRKTNEGFSSYRLAFNPTQLLSQCCPPATGDLADSVVYHKEKIRHTGKKQSMLETWISNSSRATGLPGHKDIHQARWAPQRLSGEGKWTATLSDADSANKNHPNDYRVKSVIAAGSGEFSLMPHRAIMSLPGLPSIKNNSYGALANVVFAKKSQPDFLQVNPRPEVRIGHNAATVYLHRRKDIHQARWGSQRLFDEGKSAPTLSGADSAKDANALDKPQAPLLAASAFVSVRRFLSKAEASTAFSPRGAWPQESLSSALCSREYASDKPQQQSSSTRKLPAVTHLTNPLQARCYLSNAIRARTLRPERLQRSGYRPNTTVSAGAKSTEALFSDNGIKTQPDTGVLVDSGHSNWFLPDTQKTYLFNRRVNKTLMAITSQTNTASASHGDIGEGMNKSPAQKSRTQARRFSLAPAYFIKREQSRINTLVAAIDTRTGSENNHSQVLQQKMVTLEDNIVKTRQVQEGFKQILLQITQSVDALNKKQSAPVKALSLPTYLD